MEEVWAEKFKKTGLMLFCSWMLESRLRMMTDFPTPVIPVKRVGFSFSSKSSRQ
jgi:hypothetical protein